MKEYLILDLESEILKKYNYTFEDLYNEEKKWSGRLFFDSDLDSDLFKDMLEHYFKPEDQDQVLIDLNTYQTRRLEINNFIQSFKQLYRINGEINVFDFEFHLQKMLKSLLKNQK